MKDKGERARLENAYDLASDVIGEAFDLEAFASRYAKATNQTQKREFAEQFLDHLYDLETAFQRLKEEGQLIDHMAAFADGCCSIGYVPHASAHKAALFLGLDVVTECTHAYLCGALPGQWPPPEGEHEMPDRLPTRESATPYIEAIISRFQTRVDLPEDHLNEVSARLEQEYARACLRTADDATDSVAWSAPATHKQWAKRFGTTERSLRKWRAERTLNMQPVCGRRGMWRVDEKDSLYVEWDRNRTSLKE